MERNRPLKSARRIADAAISDLRQHKEGPATKRRRVEETYSDDEEQAEEAGDGGLEDHLASCVRHVTSAEGDDALAHSTIFSQSPEEEQAHQSTESRDEIDEGEKEEEKSYFDAEAVAEQELGNKNGEVSSEGGDHWRIKKYLEENKKIIHIGKLTLNHGDMEKMVQSLRTTKVQLASFKAQVMK